MSRKFSAILLLGLRLNDDGTAQSEMVARARKAAQVYKAGVAPVIVACGGPTGKSGRTEAEVLKEELVQMGVPEARVLLEDKSMITNENISNARAILGGGRLRVALVTSDYHAFRSRLICRKMGFSPKSFSARTPEGEDKRRKKRFERVFTIDFLMGWQAPGKKRPPLAEKWMRRLLAPKP